MAIDAQNMGDELMQVVIGYPHLALLRIAAARWIKQNPSNPNVKRVSEALDACHDPATWNLTEEELQNRKVVPCQS